MIALPGITPIAIAMNTSNTQSTSIGAVYCTEVVKHPWTGAAYAMQAVNLDKEGRIGYAGSFNDLLPEKHAGRG